MSDQNLPAEAAESLEARILDLEAHLNRERAGYAENAFGIGCRAILIPIILIIGAAFLLGARGWIAFFLISTSAVLLAFILVSLFANQAQANAARRIFREEIEPALTDLQAQYRRTPAEIAAAAAAILPGNAVLRTFLDLPPAPASSSPEEPPTSQVNDL